MSNGLEYKQVFFSESFGTHAFGLKIFVAVDREITKEDENVLWEPLYEAEEAIQAAIMERTIQLDPESKIRAENERGELLELFEEPIYVEEIPNGYCSSYCCKHLPWFVVTTRIGRVKIGWRKRVINIDWTETLNKKHGKELFPTEDVTKSDTYSEHRFIHAYGYDKAKEYIQKIMETV